MKERAVNALNKVKSVLSALNRKTKIIIGGILAVALIAIIGLTAYSSMKGTDYAVLFSELNTEEASTILTKLDEYGAVYQYDGSGTIRVPAGQEPQLKAKLLQEGYPKSGRTYDTFTQNVSMMATDFEKQQYKLYDLQDRMQATLRCFDGVSDATVFITPAEDSRYVLDKTSMQPATASITLTMRDGETLTDAQAEAIRNMASRAVPGLQAENIAITDTAGNSYFIEDTGDAAQDRATQLKLETQRKIENTTRSKVLEVLEGFYGAGNVRVSVNAEVALKRTVSETVNYSTPEGAQPGTGIPSQVAKDQEVIRPTEEANAAGVVGTTSNADINTYTNANTGTVGADDTYAADRTQTNYNVDSVKTQNEDSSPQLVDLQVAVSINGNSLGSFTEPQLIAHIARAAGIEEGGETGKVSVAVAPFYDPNAPVEPEPEPGESLFDILATREFYGIPLWAIAGAALGLLLLLIVLIVVLLRRRRKKRLLRAQQEAELAAQAAEQARREEFERQQRDLLTIQNERSLELKDSIRKFSEENPEVAADLLSSWLKGGDEA